MEGEETAESCDRGYKCEQCGQAEADAEQRQVKVFVVSWPVFLWKL